jgi:hypothetical protein
MNLKLEHLDVFNLSYDKNSNLNRGWQREADLRGSAPQHGCFTLSLFLMLIASTLQAECQHACTYTLMRASVCTPAGDLASGQSCKKAEKLIRSLRNEEKQAKWLSRAN